MRNKRLLLISDPFLLIVGVLYCFVSASLCIAFFLLIGTGNYTESDVEKRLVQLLFGGLGISVVLALSICLKRWLSVIRFADGKITFYVPYRKSQCVTCDKYNYVYLSYYTHRGLFNPIGCNYRYIVISQYKLSTNDLKHINLVQANREIIKLRYSRKRWSMLFAILPQKLQMQMKKYDI